MALKRLYNGEMVSLSGPLTQADHPDRKVLADIPATAALLPELDNAHDSLLSTQVKPEAETRLAAIIKIEKSLDVRHDDLIRGVSGLLTSLAYLTRDPALAAGVLHVLSVLLPDGLDAVTRTYREEAGQAALLESRLSAADIALLKKIKILEGTAWDAVKEWMDVGDVATLEGTSTAEQLGLLAAKHGVPLHWHPGFVLPTSEVPADFRGPRMVPLAARLEERFGSGRGELEACIVGRAAVSLHRDPASWSDWEAPDEALQHLEQLWHVLVRHGRPRAGG